MTDICSSQTSISSSQLDTGKFVIPKKTRCQENTLNDLENDLSVEKQVLEETLKKSHFDLLNHLSAYKRTQIKRVENKALEDEYSRLLANRKAQISESNKKLHNSNNKISLIERSLFYVVKSDAEMMDIVKNGFTCRPSDDDDSNVLGPAAYGLHMSKHLDITLLYQYYLKLKWFYVIVVKTFYSAFRLSAPVPERNKHSYPDPSDGFEMSNQLPHNDQPIKARYYNSLVYLFDSDEDLNISEKPRNIFAWAVLKYEESQSLPLEKQLINLYINPNSKDLKQLIKLKKKQHQQALNKTNPEPPKVATPIQKPAQAFRFKPQQPPTQVVTTSPIVQSLNVKQSDRMLHCPQTVPIQNPSLDQIISPILPKCEKPQSAESKQKKLISIFGSEDSESETDDSGDEQGWAQFCYQYYMDNFNDLIEEIHTKPPRWRIIYERTGRLGVKFKSEQQLRNKKKYKGDSRFEIRLEDIRKSKLKFTNADKNQVNLKDPTNNLILTYHLKRLKNHPATTSVVKTEPEVKVNNGHMAIKEQKSERHKKLAEYSQILADIKKKADRGDLKTVKQEKTQPVEKKPRLSLNQEVTTLEKRLLAKTDSQNSQNKCQQAKNFWEPDKESEFYLTRIRSEKCEPFTDVLILTRLSLNKKVTIEYSKQFYDSNSSLFETEMEKFVRLNKNTFPCDEWTKCKIESHIKVPLRPQAEPQTRREKFRQKFVHHIRTRNLVTSFQVDNLKKYADFRDRVEIHAGGFNGLVIDTHGKQNCRQSEAATDLSEESQSSKRMPLNQNRMKAEPSEPEPLKPPEPPDEPAPPPADPTDQTKNKMHQETNTKKRTKHKKKLKHKKKRLKKSSSDSSSDSDNSESDSDEKHRHKHKQKHKHKRNRSKNKTDNPSYDFPTYDFDFDLNEEFVEHAIKSELDEFVTECAPIGLDYGTLSQVSLSLPVARPESKEAGCESRLTGSASNESTPKACTRPVQFGTPDNHWQQARSQQFSSAPGFRFNKTPSGNSLTSGLNGSLNNTLNQSTDGSKVHRFNPVKMKPNTESTNPNANVPCKQEFFR